MDCSKTEVFLAEWKRMCEYYKHCESCDANEGGCLCIKTPNNIIKNIEKARIIVQRWSDEHPLPPPKTYADDFFEKFPNAETCFGGTPRVCRDFVYGSRGGVCLKEKIECVACWNAPLPIQEEETQK